MENFTLKVNVTSCFNKDIFAVPVKTFAKIVDDFGEKITVKLLKDDLVVGVIPALNLCYLDYFVTLKKNWDSNKKEIVLLENYDTERGQFFVKVMKSIPFDDLKLSFVELVWFVRLMDDYQMTKEMSSYFFEQIENMLFTFEMFGDICDFNAGELMGNAMLEFFGIIKNQMKSIFSINKLTTKCLAFPSSRTIICELLNNYVYVDETKLFTELLDKIIELNFENKISEKAFRDLMSKIKWFCVSETKFNQRLNDIRKMYPKFNVPKKISGAFFKRRQLVSSFEPENDTFKYSEKICEGLMRNCIKYECEFNGSGTMLHTYTTTVNPIPIVFHFRSKSKRRGGHKLEISCNCNIESGKTIHACFIVKIGGSDTIHKKWTFYKPLMIEANLSDFKITFEKIYCVNKIVKPQKKNDHIQNYVAMRPNQQSRPHVIRYDSDDGDNW